MKKTLSLLLIFVLALSSISAFADESYFTSDGLYNVTGQIIGFCQMEKVTDGTYGDFDYHSFYKLTVNTDTMMVFDTPLDMLSIHDPEKDGNWHFDFCDGEQINDGFFTVNYATAVRADSADYTSLEVDDSNEISYMLGGTTVVFNTPGLYWLTATLGAEDGYSRVSQLEKVTNEGGRDIYSQPSISFEVTVTEETYKEEISDFPLYDESVVSISGITGFDESREVMGDFRIAMCVSPTVITANTDLENMGFVKYENINGQWVEAAYLDGFGINNPDSMGGWYPAEGFEDGFYEDEFIEGEIAYEEIIYEPDMSVAAGTSVTITEPGMYSMWASGVNGAATGLTFEIGDIYASYTDSRVLVDGKEIKFEAYNINDNNYFKLRDIAYALTNYGSGARKFNVDWDGTKNMISLMSNSDYAPVGGELVPGDGQDKAYEISSSAILKDRANVTMNAFLINGNNYFKLRDLGKLFDFNVSWDGINNCILIDTTSSYIE